MSDFFVCLTSYKFKNHLKNILKTYSENQAQAAIGVCKERTGFLSEILLLLKLHETAKFSGFFSKTVKTEDLCGTSKKIFFSKRKKQAYLLLHYTTFAHPASSFKKKYLLQPTLLTMPNHFLHRTFIISILPLITPQLSAL